MTMNLDLRVPAGKFSYGELEGNVSADGGIVSSWVYLSITTHV